MGWEKIILTTIITVATAIVQEMVDDWVHYDVTCAFPLGRGNTLFF